MYQEYNRHRKKYHHRQETAITSSTCRTCQICIDTENTFTAEMNSYRPRGSLARILYERQLNDNYLSKIDKSEWYQCELELLPSEISTKFIQLGLDEDTETFLKRSEEKSDWIFTQLWHSILKAFLGLFMSQTSINGWLQRGSMFVLSHLQFLKLIDKNDYWQSDDLLDLGAGDGEVTKQFACFFKNVYVTEVSTTMQHLLTKKGYKLLQFDDWFKKKKYDFISTLNLLDRCDKPLELLNYIKSSLKPDGRVLLAIVLPYSPYVESGTPNHVPEEVLPIEGSSFEEQIDSFVNNVIKPSGFELISWSRLPYLCEGDLAQSFYWLDDVVFVLKVNHK